MLEFLSSFPSASDFRPQKKPRRENWNQTGRRGEEGMWSEIRDQMSEGGAGEALRSVAHKGRSHAGMRLQPSAEDPPGPKRAEKSSGLEPSPHIPDGPSFRRAELLIGRQPLTFCGKETLPVHGSRREVMQRRWTRTCLPGRWGAREPAGQDE